MLLRHMTDMCHDLPAQMHALSRLTTNMLISTLCATSSREDELYLDIMNVAETDWDDATHTVRAEFVPSFEQYADDRTRLEITAQKVHGDENSVTWTTTLTLSVLLANLGTKNHTEYAPITWSIDVTKTRSDNKACDFTSKTDKFFTSSGVGVAVLRMLTIQLGVPLAIKNKYIGASVIDEMHTYGMPESNETLFLRLGLDHLMDLIKDAAPTD